MHGADERRIPPPSLPRRAQRDRVPLVPAPRHFDAVDIIECFSPRVRRPPAEGIATLLGAQLHTAQLRAVWGDAHAIWFELRQDRETIEQILVTHARIELPLAECFGPQIDATQKLVIDPEDQVVRALRTVE